MYKTITSATSSQDLTIRFARNKTDSSRECIVEKELVVSFTR